MHLVHARLRRCAGGWLRFARPLARMCWALAGVGRKGQRSHREEHQTAQRTRLVGRQAARRSCHSEDRTGARSQQRLEVGQ